MAQTEYIVRSRPMRVRFAGFESTTTELQRAGWVLVAEEDYMRARIRLLMRHEDAGLYLVANEVEYRYETGFGRHMQISRGDRDLEFIVTRVAKSIHVLRTDWDLSKFKQIDAEPHGVDVELKRIEDFALFGAPMVKTQEIIIEPQSVAECLDLIKKMQAPNLAEIRRRNRASEREIDRQQAFHAQILSIAA